MSASFPVRKTQRALPRAGSLLTREPLLLTAFLLAVLYFARPLLIPLAFALTLAFLLAPAVARLERLRFRRAPATLLVLAGASALLGGAVYLGANQLLTAVNDLPSHAPNIRVKLARTHVPANSALGQAFTSIEGLSREFLPEPAREVQLEPGRATSRARRVAEAAKAQGMPEPTPVIVIQPPPSEFAALRAFARPVLAPFGIAGMVLIFTTYMLLKRENLRSRLLLLAGIGRIHLVSNALDDAAARISRYLIANVLVNAGFGLVFGATLYAIGLPYAVLWGALFALLRTIPYAGTVIGGALPAMFALIYFPGFWQAGCTLAFLALLEILVANILEPRLYGAHTGISEIGLLTMAVFWLLLWGWPGLALSTPLTACLIVLGRTLPQLSFLHILLGDDAALAPEAAFYERMLATDSAEARLIAERYLRQFTEPEPAARASRRGKPRTAPTNQDPGERRRRSGFADLSPYRGKQPPVRNPTLALYEQVLLPALALAESDRHKGILSEQQASFILNSIAELVAELTIHGVTTPQAAASALPFAEREPHARLGPPAVCIPALDQADEIAAAMLAQLLEKAGHKTLLLPPSALTPELLHRLAADPTTAVYISALPPFAFASARALYLRLYAELPRNPITVALWRGTTEPDLLALRLGMSNPQDNGASPNRAVTTFAGALQALETAEPPASLAYAG